MISTTTNVKTMITTDLAASSLPRRGTAAKVLAMAPDEYSDVTRRTPKHADGKLGDG